MLRAKNKTHPSWSRGVWTGVKSLERLDVNNVYEPIGKGNLPRDIRPPACSLLSVARIQSLDFSYLDHLSGLDWQQAAIGRMQRIIAEQRQNLI